MSSAPFFTTLPKPSTLFFVSLFQKARNMYSLQKQAKSLKKELKNIHIEAENEGITAVVSAEQEVLSLSISDSAWNDAKAAEFGKKKLENTLLKTLNKGLKKAQEIAGSKMKGIWGEMGVGQG